MDIKIEKGVPIPEPIPGVKGVGTYPFSKMGVGDRIEIPPREGVTARKLFTRAWASAYHYKKSMGKLDWDFTGRTIDGKVYIWRTK